MNIFEMEEIAHSDIDYSFRSNTSGTGKLSACTVGFGRRGTAAKLIKLSISVAKYV